MATPPVEQVVDGLWSVPVVIPDNPLGYTLVYVFETASGPVLVDNGWDADAAWTALKDGLAETGHDVSDVYGCLVTHQHPDHHGLSERLRTASGGWIAMHPEDAWVVTRRREGDDEWLLQTAGVMLQAGASESDIASLPDLTDLPKPEPPSLPTRLFADGDVVDVPGWTVRAVWTPGHTPGHCCFAVDEHALLLTGDHVLPVITPHIGLFSEASEFDPLGDYLDSLAKLHAETGVELVLPAHQHRFAGLGARLRELTEHHEERLAVIEACLRETERTLWEIAEAMPWNRAWEDIPVFMKRAALSEAQAHLRYLERRSRVELVPGAWPTTYRLTARAEPHARAGS